MLLFIYYWGIDMKNEKRSSFLTYALLVLNSVGNTNFAKVFYQKLSEIPKIINTPRNKYIWAIRRGEF